MNGPSFGCGCSRRWYVNSVAPDRITLRTTFRDTRRSRAIALMPLPRPKCSRRIRAIVSTTSIPKPDRSFPRPALFTTLGLGSLFDADHPELGVLLARRSTALEGAVARLIIDALEAPSAAQGLIDGAKWYFLTADYAFGHENCGGFANTFTDAGGEIVAQLWNPLDTADFGPYIGQIQDADPDAVFVLQVGGDSVRFVESWSEFGMKDQIPLLGGETLLDQSLLRGMDPGAAEGLLSVGKFAEGRDDAVTQEFVESFDEAHDLVPSYYASVCFQAAEWTALALEEINGNIEDQEAFLDAVRGLEFDSAGGPMRLDEYDNPVQNVYVREVQEREDGRLWNVPIHTFEDVSQFWTYDPEEFLEQPVYSREFQGID
jgi:hypothetical protein